LTVAAGGLVVHTVKTRDGFDEWSDVSAQMPVAKDGEVVHHGPPPQAVPDLCVAGGRGAGVDEALVAFDDLGSGAGDEIEIRRLAPGEQVGEARAEGSRRARRRAAQQLQMDRWETPAARRAELVAASAAIAAAVAASEAASAASPTRRGGRLLRRLVVLVAILVVAAAAAALVGARTPVTPLSWADARFVGAQLATADRHVRAQLVRLRGHATARARDRTRESIATTRSLALEVRYARGAEARRLQRALRLEGDWLDAVGSTLSNPRSPLRMELLARDRPLRLALAALAAPAARRMAATQHLVGYARSRVRATGAA
jgi:hypothetical protein